MPDAETRTPGRVIYGVLAAEALFACSRESPREKGMVKAKYMCDDGRCTVNRLM